jgi:uncharacterized lipoprotein YehR (DUF1307 family)
MKTSFRLKHLLLAIIFSLAIVFQGCKYDDEDDLYVQPINSTYITLSFAHKVDGDVLQLNSLNKPYTNAMGQKYNVSKLRYLVSNITLHQINGAQTKLEGYFFIDISKPETFDYTPSVQVPFGSYSGISYTFGFDENSNISGNYPVLNAANWNWPDQFGGGYHFMQLEGQFIDSTNNDAPFATHMGTARKIDSSGTTFEANHFTKFIQKSNFEVNNSKNIVLTMNINEWYTNPTNWDFNQYGAGIMPNYNAQKLLNTNGKDVFTATIN